MTKRPTHAGSNQTAALLLIAYLDVAILGGVALIAEFAGNADQFGRSPVAQGCSADLLTDYNPVLDGSARLHRATGPDSTDVPSCFDDPSQLRRQRREAQHHSE